MTSDPAITRQSLAAQQALAPYALAALTVGALFLLPVGLKASQPQWMAAPLIAFALAFAALRWARRRLAARPEVALASAERAHVLTGVVCAAAVMALTAFGAVAGPMRETVSLLALGAALLIAFFTAPHLPSLLIVAPLAAAPPLAAIIHLGGPLIDVAVGATALGFAPALIMNRAHRRQFALAAEREALIAQREAALADAERLARDKSALISTLSSQVRGGLGAVEQSLAIALAARRGRGAGDPLGAALDGLRELGVTVASVLDAEDAEAGRLSLQPEPFDIVALCGALVEEQRPTAAAKGLDLRLLIDGESLDGSAVGDPARVRQTLAALLANAVRYTVRGQVILSLAREGGCVRMSVADTGPGLSAEELTAARAPFQRVGRTSAGVPGAGLGLALADRLAGLMGAGLEIDSAVGVGSRFSLRLPYDPTPAAAPTPVPLVEPLRLLTVGGDALSAAQLRAAAETLGAQVVHAARPERAPGLTRRAAFDAVVLDAPPPALLRMLAAEPALREAPLLALLGTDGAEAAASLAAGADAVLRKPVDPSALGQALSEARRLRRESRAAA